MGDHALTTTTIGAFPKPPYVPISDWFTRRSDEYTDAYPEEVRAAGDDAEVLFERATREVVRAQVEAGIDIPTDGEVRRENYIHYQCRHLDGFDFDELAEKHMRGTTSVRLPTITGPVVGRESPLGRDFMVAQAATDRPVKITLPGPMTIIDSTVDRFYDDEISLGEDLAAALNGHIRALVDAGCRYVQIDEPVMARRPQAALAHGINQLARCFEGVPAEITRVVHACCGYPNELDQHDYAKAPRSSYLELAEALDDAPFDAISIEDAHRHNDLGELLPRFRSSTVVLGVVAIASSRVESVDEIRDRLTAAVVHVAPERLIAAPDCGLGYLPRDLALAKLRALTTAARSF